MRIQSHGDAQNVKPSSYLGWVTSTSCHHKLTPHGLGDLKKRSAARHRSCGAVGLTPGEQLLDLYPGIRPQGQCPIVAY